MEVSPFPFSALKNEGKYYYLLTNLLIEQSKRGYAFLGGVSHGVKSYYGVVRYLPSRIKRDVEIKSHVCEVIMKIINGSLSSEELNIVLQELGYTYSPPLGPIECKSILENLIVAEFADSHPSNPSKRKDCVGLGPMAISYVEKLTSLPDSMIEQGFSLIQSLPMLNSYSRVEELYLKLSKKILTFDEWPLCLKTVAIP